MIIIESSDNLLPLFRIDINLIASNMFARQNKMSPYKYVPSKSFF